MLSPYDLRLITLRGAHDGELPVYAELSGRQWEYLVGLLDPHPAACATICVWQVGARRWHLPPEYLAEYRRRALGDRHSLLVVSYRDREEPFSAGRSWVDFAWRLERHWLVEWSDAKDPLTRPPIVFAADASAPVLIGGGLSPRLRTSSAALTAFPLVSADEIRAAFRFRGEPEPRASEISRALSYFEDCGLIITAPDSIAENYWGSRDVGKRPLRLFVNLVADAWSWTGGRRHLGLRRPDVYSSAAEQLCELTPKGLPAESAARMLSIWNYSAEALRERGLRTV